MIDEKRDKVELPISNKDLDLESGIYEYLQTRDISKLDLAYRNYKMTDRVIPPLRSLDEFVVKPPTDTQNLLNNWYLERTKVIAIVAATGIGKSVLSMQLACNFALGLETIKLKPNGCLKTLIVQCEDSDNDLALMRDGAVESIIDNYLQNADPIKQQIGIGLDRLEDDYKLKCKTNVKVVDAVGYTGVDFIDLIDTYCHDYKPDIVIINPLGEFFGEDLNNNEKIYKFLKILKPMLQKHNCGCIFVAHPVKQGKGSRQKQTDSDYEMYGGAAWANSVRSIISIRAEEDDYIHFTMHCRKRSDKLGWSKLQIKRSGDVTKPHWILCNQLEINERNKRLNGSESTGDKNKELVLNSIPFTGSITIDDIIGKVGMSASTIRSKAKLLLYENRIAVRMTIELGNKLEGKPPVGYYRLEKPNEN